ncbi:MAG: hypothetical protein BHV98_03635 [Clostridium sp. CAG:217_53_7]|nr:MAG: hypothetical protein BHV98_03635 [Clostridium sp. CAG:217_53_7]
MTICPEERCTGCGACQSACPADCIALALNRAGDRVAMIDFARCFTRPCYAKAARRWLPTQ